jgi:hypothetical protein
MMNWKGCERKRSGPDFKALSENLLRGTEKTTKTLSEYRRSPGRDLNLGPPDNEAGVLTTPPRHDIWPPFRSHTLGLIAHLRLCSFVVNNF